VEKPKTILPTIGVDKMTPFQEITQPDSTDKIKKLFIILSAFFLGQALQFSDGYLSKVGIILLAFSIGLLLLSIIFKKIPLRRFNFHHIRILIILGFIWQIAQLLTQLPGIFILDKNLEHIWIFKLLIALAGCFALISLASLKKAPQRLAIILVFANFFGAGIWMIKASPDPHIDVFVFQQTSSKALLRGENPYTQPTPNIFGEQTPLYGNELKNGDSLTFSNPYPPLSIYASSLGYIVGKDIRYSHLSAIIAVAVLIILINPSRDSLLISYLFLFTPRVFFVLEQSWTEPIVLLFTTIAIWSAVKNPKWLSYALGLMIASKQYLIFVFPFLYFIIPPKTNWLKLIKPLAALTATGLIVTAFLALLDIPSFLWNVGIIQWYQPFRMNALSFTALYAHLFQEYPPIYIPFLALLLAFLFAKHYLHPSPRHFALSLSLALSIFFSFNKQAFCNYYFLLLGCLAVAANLLPSFSNMSYENTPSKFIK
jgi:hypothetical protein